VLFVTPLFERGGTETYIINLTEYLKEKDIYCTIISAGGVREEELLNMGIKHIKVNCLSKKSLLNAFIGIYRIIQAIKQEKINLIHASSIYTTILSKIATIALLKQNIKVIMTLCGGPNKNIEKNSAKMLDIFANKVIALSQDAKKKLIRYGLNKNKIEIVNIGIKPFKKVDNNTLQGMIICNCGRFTEQKGQRYLIEAIEKINLRDIKYWIIGRGKLKGHLQNQIDSLKRENNVEILESRTYTADLLNQIDIFILPSLWEQFPITILEAMSIGKSIIATNVNGVPEELGDCGILINPANVDEIVDAIKLLAEDESLRKTLGQKAEERFYKYFTQEIMGEKTIKVYEEMLKA